MVSTKQLAANRRNAQKSTGPKTPQGKSATAQNALKHGLRSNRILIASDNPAEFAAHHTALLEEYQPVGPMETILTERIIQLTWRLFRIARIQSGTFDTLTEQPKTPTQKTKEWETWPDDFPITAPQALEILAEEGTKSFAQKILPANIEYEKKHTPQTVNKPQASNDPDQPDNRILGRIAVTDFSDTRVLDRLLMYERRIENSLYKTHLELERIQNRRKCKEQKENLVESVD